MGIRPRHNMIMSSRYLLSLVAIFLLLDVHQKISTNCLVENSLPEVQQNRRFRPIQSVIRKYQSNFDQTGPNGEWPPIPFGSATIQIWYENLSIELDKIHFFLYETWWQKRKLDDDGYQYFMCIKSTDDARCCLIILISYITWL